MSFIIIISSKDSMTILQDLFYPPSIAFIITLLYYIFYLLTLFINLSPFTRMLHKWVQRFFTSLFTAVSPAPKTVFYTVCTLNKYLLNEQRNVWTNEWSIKETSESWKYCDLIIILSACYCSLIPGSGMSYLTNLITQYLIILLKAIIGICNAKSLNRNLFIINQRMTRFLKCLVYIIHMFFFSETLYWHL